MELLKSVKKISSILLITLLVAQPVYSNTKVPAKDVTVTDVGPGPCDNLLDVQSCLAALNAGGVAEWGSISGNIEDQVDLQEEFDTKQNSIGFTPENVANKSTSTSLGTSNTLYPSQGAVKSYVDTGLGTKQNTITTGTTAQYFRGDLSLATFPTAVSSFTNDSGYITASSVSTLTNKSGNISQWTNNSGYLTSADLSGYVPYTGATSDLNLGLNGLVANDINISAQTASRILSTDSSKNITALDTATYPSLTELSYVKGVTSAIQTQIDGKQASGNYITALTGDGLASGPGSSAFTLATVNSNVGSFGSSTSIPSFTVNGKGLITAASGNAVIAQSGTLTGTTLASNVVTSSLTTVGTLINLTVTNPIIGSITGNAATATALLNARTIGGVSFDGTANITVASATGGFTISGGDLALGANNITMTGSIGTTGSRLTKGWFTDLQVTNAIAGSITGSAATLTTARAIYGNNFDGSAALSQIIASTFGGTGNGFTKFSGPTTSEKTFTLPNASATVLTDNAAVTVAQGGTGRATGTTAYALVATGTTATGAQQTLANGATTEILVGGGASALPVWTTANGSGAPVRATSPALTTPDLGTPTALVGTNITGTASGFTAGNVTTNANLTGDITSVGNASTIAPLIVPTSDLTAKGPRTSAFNAGATITAMDLVILDSSSTWQKTDANTSSIYAGMIGVSLESKTSGQAMSVALTGTIIRNDAWSWTPGAVLYMSETAGAITATQPSTSNAAIRVIGFAVTADDIYFNPSPDYITHT